MSRYKNIVPIVERFAEHISGGAKVLSTFGSHIDFSTSASFKKSVFVVPSFPTLFSPAHVKEEIKPINPDVITRNLDYQAYSKDTNWGTVFNILAKLKANSISVPENTQYQLLSNALKMKDSDQRSIFIETMLSEYGFKINCKNKADTTLLYTAIDNLDMEDVELLLANGADPKIKSMNDTTYRVAASRSANTECDFQIAYAIFEKLYRKSVPDHDTLDVVCNYFEAAPNSIEDAARELLLGNFVDHEL